MNDIIYSQQFNKLFNTVKSQLPKHTTAAQFQGIAMYASMKLQEAQKGTGKKVEKITFNPLDTSVGAGNDLPTKSVANMSHQKYKTGNRKKS